MHWREVLHSYLSACAQDDREVVPEAHVRSFLEQFATSALRQREQQRWADRRRVSQQVPPPESYEAIEDAPQSVIAEVERRYGTVTRAMRFRLVHEGGGWRLDDYFNKCSLCDDGACPDCHGTGRCVLCEGVGVLPCDDGAESELCDLCNGQATCRFCLCGRCRYCIESGVPGWQSLTRRNAEIQADER